MAVAIAEEGVGVTAIKVAKTMLDAVSDMDPGKHGNAQTMEDVIKGKAKPGGGSTDLFGEGKKAGNSDPFSTGKSKASVAEAKAGEGTKHDITGQKLSGSEMKQMRSIKGEHMSDIFSRATNTGDSINGETAIKGSQHSVQSVASLQKSCEMAKTMNLEAHRAAGMAIHAKAELGAKMSQQGPQGPGGMGQAARSAPHHQLTLNNYAPKPPSFREEGTGDDGASSWA
jgi:hypothetical protein